MKILLVDDTQDNLDVLAIMLQNSGYEVVSVVNGAEALEKLHADRFDMIISDIMMPVMDGFQFCRKCKEDKNLISIPFIFYTATYTDAKDEELASKLGVDKFIKKPMAPAEFIMIIKQVIRDVEEGKITPKKPVLEEEKEVFKLYSERLVLKLEEKNLDLEREIIEHKRAEDELQLFSKTIQQTADIIFITDRDGVIEFVNHAFEKITGYIKEEALGQNPRILKSGLIDSKEFEKLWNTILSGKVFRNIPINKKKNGELFHYDQTITPMKDKQGNITHFISTGRDITEHKRVEEALRKSERRLCAITDTAKDAIIMIDNEGKITYWNPASEEIFGYSAQEVMGEAMHPLIVSDKYIEDYKKGLELFKETGKGNVVDKTLELQAYKKDRSEITVEVSLAAIKIEGQWNAVGIVRDITEHKKLEAQYHHAQKMEAIGRLAGGVAHDFNNLLTVIGGNTSLAMMTLNENDPLMHDLEQVQKAANRASNLTRQLLAFSRKQKLQPEILNLNILIADIEKMLCRVIGEDIELESILAEDLWNAKVDSGQFEQIIMNLCVNARDAMPDGGQLIIETENTELNEEYTSIHPEVAPGAYVMLVVSDSGSGMTEEVKSQIFDPFFTTKAVGEGTGLGLSTVFGIVKQSGGFIYVYSEPGEGTTFKIYLPRSEEEAVTVRKKLLTEEELRGKETVLVVEDEEGVRNIAVRSLRKYGYKVLEAENGGAGYLKCKSSEKPVDLIITDVVMPEMSGAEFIKSVKEFWPEVKVLYMSGYTHDVIAKKGIIDSKVAFLHKPFEPLNILQKVREVLNS